MVPIINDAVTEGEETLVDPEALTSSASGWVASNKTAGNNDIANKSSQSTTISQSFADTFDYPYDTTLGPTGGSNIDAAAPTPSTLSTKSTTMRTNMDGQKHPTIAKTQTLGSGQPGTCRMYICTPTTPNCDDGLQNDNIGHEFTHGIANRLTGGGTG